MPLADHAQEASRAWTSLKENLAESGLGSVEL